jgi:hypothetical protein
VTLLLAALLLAQADAGVAQRVRVTVRAIAATNESDPPGMDPKLTPIAPHLPQLFKTYKLLKEQTFDLDWKAPADMDLPGNRSLQIIPRDLGADGMIKVHLELLGEHPAHSRKLHTDYSIARGGTILIGGLQVDREDPKKGTLLIAITQAVEK